MWLRRESGMGLPGFETNPIPERRHRVGAIDNEVAVVLLHREIAPIGTPARRVHAFRRAREREVLQHLAAGASNRHISRSLSITEKTASVHVSNILGKLNVRTRAEAVALIHRLALTEGS